MRSSFRSRSGLFGSALFSALLAAAVLAAAAPAVPVGGPLDGGDDPTLTVIKHVVNDDGGTSVADDFQLSVDQVGGNEQTQAGSESGVVYTVEAGMLIQVDETGPAGYQESQSGDCAVIPQVGQSYACTVTNDDEAPEVTVVKSVVNDDGGAATPDQFQITVSQVGEPDQTNDGSPTGKTYAVKAGKAIVVTETGPGGYAMTQSVACDDTPALDQAIVCTVTNDDIAPVVKVVKHVVNDNGGTAVAGDFTMKLEQTGETQQSGAGSEAGTDHTVRAGKQITVSETGPSGYAESQSADCSVTPALGQSYTCTVTNDDIAPKLIVKKVVVNEPGGEAVPADFLMIVSQSAPVSQFAGSETGETVTLTAGSDYSVAEADNPNRPNDYTGLYTEQMSADCAGPAILGQTKTCTITNTRKTGTIELVKQLVPATGSGRFNLKLDGVSQNVFDSPSTEFADNDTTGQITVITGDHAVAEAGADEASNLSHYLTALECTKPPIEALAPVETVPVTDGDVPVGFGEHVTCVLTNTRKAQVTIKKLTDPAGDLTTRFGFTTDLEQGGAFSLNDGETKAYEVGPGAYSVTEDDPYSLGYKLANAACTETIPNEVLVDAPPRDNQMGAAERTRSFTADAGDVIACTFTNRQLVGLQVVLKTPEAQSTYIDGTVSYQYDVTSSGSSDLTDVAVADDRCPGPAARQADVTGDNDAVLEVGETWRYTCSVAASALFAGTSGPVTVTNTVTVTAKDQAGKEITSKDTAATTLLAPGIAIEKSGPATALAGELLTYDLKVTNTGNTAFNDGMVVLTDAQCQAPPALLSKNGDATPAELNPGESWNYQCQVQTQAGQVEVNNVGEVKGTDAGGKVVTASAAARTTLTPPAAAVSPTAVVSGRSQLTGTVGCATQRYAKASVTGRQIKSVAFYVNGKKVKTLARPNIGSKYQLRMTTKSLQFGAYKVRAVVTFKPAAKTKAKTLRLQFSRCEPRVVQPKFTG